MPFSSCQSLVKLCQEMYPGTCFLLIHNINQQNQAKIHFQRNFSAPALRNLNVSPSYVHLRKLLTGELFP